MYANVNNVESYTFNELLTLRKKYYERLIPERKYKDKKDKEGYLTGYHIDPRYPNLKFKLK